MYELKDILLSDNVVERIKNNKKDLLKIIPELEELDFRHNHPHHIAGTIWDHVLLALSLSENDFDIRLALLLHDIGKKRMCVIGEDGVSHYKGHADESARMSDEILRRLGFSEDYIGYICYLIRYHDTPITETSIESNYDICETLYKIQCCDALAHHPNYLEKRKMYLDNTRELLDRHKKTL